MNVPLVRDEAVVERIAAMFSSRGRAMVDSNLRQADVPVGATLIPQTRGTAPGLICPVGHKVIYAVPGVPYEMQEMLERAVLPDLRARAGTAATIVSRVLRTWGLAESTLAEQVGPRLAALDARGGNPTIAFLASGIEGIKVRVTAKGATRQEALALVEAEDAELRTLLGTIVFGVDDDTMESAVGALVEEAGLTLAVAESLTGGLVASRLVEVPGASRWFKGGVVSYASEVKFDLLGVPPGPVVSEPAAAAMAEGVAKLLGTDIGLSVTGVAGPEEQEGQPVGTVFFGVTLDGRTDVVHIRLPGDRPRVRQYATISLLDLLRRRLLERGAG
jgi:nicotinamide-nucleotide amidase